MGEVINLFTVCTHCKQPRPAFFLKADDKRICWVCFEETASELERERVVFEGLLAMGIDRETANIMMIAKHDHERSRRPTRG